MVQLAAREGHWKLIRQCLVLQSAGRLALLHKLVPMAVKAGQWDIVQAALDKGVNANSRMVRFVRQHAERCQVQLAWDGNRKHLCGRTSIYEDPWFLKWFRSLNDAADAVTGKVDLELREDGVGDVCDSDAELVCAKLNGIDISGDCLAMQQAIDLYSKLTRKTRSLVKEESESESEGGCNKRVISKLQTSSSQFHLRYYTRKACVRDIRYGQRSIKHEFQDGRQYSEFVRQLYMGALDPLHDMNFKPFPLRACRYKGHLRCLDNRRLYCLKQFQDQKPHEDVLVLVQVVELNEILQTFISHMSESSNVGSDIVVRPLAKRRKADEYHLKQI